MVDKPRRKPKAAPAVRAPERSVLSLVLGDASALGLWVLLSSLNEELTALLADALGVSGLVAGLAVLVTTLALYDPICGLVGGAGASFNPSQNFAFAAAGRGSLGVHCLRSVAQAAGGALGAAAAVRVVPAPWRGKFGNYSHGVVPGSSIAAGAATEAGLAFALNLVILWSLSTKRKVAAGLAPYAATILLVPLGGATSGPFMNPAFASAWFAVLRGPALWEHFAVYWLGCLAGSYAAGLAWWLAHNLPGKQPVRPSRPRPAARAPPAAAQPAPPPLRLQGRRSRVKPRAAKPAVRPAPQAAAAGGGKKQD